MIEQIAYSDNLLITRGFLGDHASVNVLRRIYIQWIKAIIILMFQAMRAVSY